jgi:hypothetical protein
LLLNASSIWQMSMHWISPARDPSDCATEQGNAKKEHWLSGINPKTTFLLRQQEVSAEEYGLHSLLALNLRGDLSPMNN